MNLTLSVDEQLIERAREAARQRGSSLNGLIRQFLEGLAGKPSGKALAAEIDALFTQSPGHSGGKKIKREDAYKGRV